MLSVVALVYVPSIKADSFTVQIARIQDSNRKAFRLIFRGGNQTTRRCPKWST